MAAFVSSSSILFCCCLLEVSSFLKRDRKGVDPDGRGQREGKLFILYRKESMLNKRGKQQKRDP